MPNYQEAVERAVGPMPGLFTRLLQKATKPPGSGWVAIPKGKRGGMRRQFGGKWEYWYPVSGRPELAAHLKPAGPLSADEVHSVMENSGRLPGAVEEELQIAKKWAGDTIKLGPGAVAQLKERSRQELNKPPAAKPSTRKGHHPDLDRIRHATVLDVLAEHEAAGTKKGGRAKGSGTVAPVAVVAAKPATKPKRTSKVAAEPAQPTAKTGAPAPKDWAEKVMAERLASGNLPIIGRDGDYGDRYRAAYAVASIARNKYAAEGGRTEDLKARPPGTKVPWRAAKKVWWGEVLMHASKVMAADEWQGTGDWGKGPAVRTPGRHDAKPPEAAAPKTAPTATATTGKRLVSPAVKQWTAKLKATGLGKMAGLGWPALVAGSEFGDVPLEIRNGAYAISSGMVTGRFTAEDMIRLRDMSGPERMSLLAEVAAMADGGGITAFRQAAIASLAASKPKPPPAAKRPKLDERPKVFKTPGVVAHENLMKLGFEASEAAQVIQEFSAEHAGKDEKRRPEIFQGISDIAAFSASPDAEKLLKKLRTKRPAGSHYLSAPAVTEAVHSLGAGIRATKTKRAKLETVKLARTAPPLSHADAKPGHVKIRLAEGGIAEVKGEQVGNFLLHDPHGHKPGAGKAESVLTDAGTGMRVSSYQKRTTARTVAKKLNALGLDLKGALAAGGAKWKDVSAKVAAVLKEHKE